MIDWKTFISYYWTLGIFTVPITFYTAYVVITELLDLIFNSNKINKLLKHSDNLDASKYEKQYNKDKFRLSTFEKSNLFELERQITYIRLIEKERKSTWANRTSIEVKEKITSAKKVSDIFKIK
jgi:hypothetical protein